MHEKVTHEKVAEKVTAEKVTDLFFRKGDNHRRPHPSRTCLLRQAFHDHLQPTIPVKMVSLQITRQD